MKENCKKRKISQEIKEKRKKQEKGCEVRRKRKYGKIIKENKRNKWGRKK